MDISDYPTPQHFLLHISDTHLVSGHDRLHGIIDSDANLTALFDNFDRAGTCPDAIVLTGDIADTGASDAYDRAREIVEKAAARYGAQVIWVIGNHDERIAFGVGLLDEQPSLDTIDRVFDINGLRIIALDSTVHGRHHGEITEDQVRWLTEVLAEPAPHGSILALHHPPIPSMLGLIRYVDLREQARLATALEGSDVRAILAGHLHYNTSGTFAGIPVSVASATCYTQDLNVEFPDIRGINTAQSYNLVHVYDDVVAHSTVPVGDFTTVYEMTPEQLAAFERMTPGDQQAAIDSASH